MNSESFDIAKDTNNNADIEGAINDVFGGRRLMQSHISRILGVVPVPVAMSSEVLPTLRGPPPSHLKPLDRIPKHWRNNNNKEELLRISELRAEQPYLTRAETYEYRNTFYQNLCLNILKEGYHRTFSELFHLISKQEKARHDAGPDSILWLQTPLNLQKEKLELLREELCNAEVLTRMADHEGAYHSYYRLAEQFAIHPDDKWLSDHFFTYCLDTAFKIEDDGRHKAEANLHLGTAVEKNGDFKKALGYFKEFYKLSNGKDWLDQQEQRLHKNACKDLARVFTSVASSLPTNDASRLMYLKDAHEMAKESENKKLEGQCGYRLGLAYEQLGRPDTALLLLRSFYELSKDINDDENLGLACEAMAKAYERQGKLEESIRFLKEFEEVTRRSNQEQLYSRACRDLGTVFNNRNKYNDAADYFKKAFKVSQSLHDTQSANESRVLIGVALGNQMSSEYYSKHVEVANRCALERLIDWKNQRTNANFKKPIENEEEITLASRKPSREKVFI